MIIRPRRIRTKVLGYLMYPFSHSSSIEIISNVHTKSPLYSAIPSSPTSTISSIDPLSPRSTISDMSRDSDNDNDLSPNGRRESYPLSEASTSSVGSSSKTRFHEKDYQYGEEDNYEFDPSESSGLLGFIPKWSREIEHKLPLPLSFGQNRKQRRQNRKKKYLFLPTLMVVLCGTVIVGGIYVCVQGMKTGTGNTDDESTYVETSNGVDTQAQASQMTPEWVMNVREIPEDATHILIPPHEAEDIELLSPLHDRLPYDVLESYFSTGLLPSTFNSGSPHAAQQPLDLVYLYVNATSEYLQENMVLSEEQEGIELYGKKRHWRDNGELRGAIRSSIKGLNENIGNIHVISADWGMTEKDKNNLGFTQDESDLEEWRIGQIPEWLNWESQKDQIDGKLKWHFHSDIFKLPVKSNGQVITRSENDTVIIARAIENWSYLEDESVEEEVEEEEEFEGISENEDGRSEYDLPMTPVIARIEPPVPVQVFWDNESEWKQLAAPSFNSFAIESRMSWLRNVSENFIAFNDDMFILRDLSKADFRHPLLGNILRMDSGLLVDPSMTPYQLTDSGEWGALQHANELLSSRFPRRKRMYLHHLPKTQSKSMLHEAVTMFKDELSLSTTRTFRESKRGKGDLEMAWLTTNLRIERWREALLWSWIVAKIGNKQGNGGMWNNHSRSELIDLLRITENHISGSQSVIVQKRGNRTTLADSFDLDEQVNWEGPKASMYQFSSLDGHLNLLSDEPKKRCLFSLHQCLPPNFFTDAKISYSSEEIFKKMVFAEPSCGDCLIDALINESGQRGIEAFLPTPDQVYYPSEEAQELSKQRDWITTEPILQLTNSWEDSDFTIEANVFEDQDVWSGAPKRKDGGIELRRWCIKLLSRYTYVFASTPSRFSPIHNYGQLATALLSVEDTPDLAMFCVNDDQNDSSDGGRIKRLFGGWMKAKFGDEEIPGVNYEKENIEWDIPTTEDERTFTLEQEQEESEKEEERRYRSVRGRPFGNSGNYHNRIIQKASYLNDNEQPNYNDDNDNEYIYNEHGWYISPANNIPDAEW